MNSVMPSWMLKSGIMNAQTPPELNQGVKQVLFDFYWTRLVDDLGFSRDLMADQQF